MMTILNRLNKHNQAKLLQRHLLSLLLLSIITPAAYADEFKFDPFLSAALSYDDNVYLLADGEDENQIIGQDQRSDTIIDATIGVKGKYNSRSSKIKFGARIFRRDYSNFDILNLTGGNANARGEWDIGKRWTTQLGYRFDRDQSNFSEENLAQGDIFDSHRANAGLTLHVDRRRDLYVNVIYKDKDYEQRLALANERTDINIGYRQFSKKKNSIALELSHADGNYPNRLSFANNIDQLQDYTEDSVKLLTSWRLGEKTKLEANAGYIDRQHNEQLANFDYNGLVFDIDLEWSITPKTQFIAQVAQSLRDTENTNTLFNKVQRLQLGFNWNSSKRLRFSTALTLLDLEFFQQGENREDDGSTLEFGASYDINRRSSLESKIKIRTRNSNRIDNEYDNNIATIKYMYML